MNTPPSQSPAARPSRWRIDADPAAIRAGAGVALVFAVPFQIGAQVAGSGSGWSLALRLASLVGFLLGAGVAAWVQDRDLPLAHGLVTAIGAFAVAQLAFVLVRAFAGNDLRLLAAAANLAPVAGVGLLGGRLGLALQRTGARPGARRDGGSK